MEKQRRRQRIVKLVHEKSIASQQELAVFLEQDGHPVTQATLSRDLRELNLVKTAHGYRLPSDLNQSRPGGNNLRQSIAQYMVLANVANNLVVVKTHPGNASPLAISLDSIGWGEIVGTVAGDDTVLVVTPTPQSARMVQRRLKELAGNEW
jgi:transcriptional regulator of arginine metabolism